MEKKHNCVFDLQLVSAPNKIAAYCAYLRRSESVRLLRTCWINSLDPRQYQESIWREGFKRSIKSIKAPRTVQKADNSGSNPANLFAKRPFFSSKRLKQSLTKGWVFFCALSGDLILLIRRVAIGVNGGFYWSDTFRKATTRFKVAQS